MTFYSATGNIVEKNYKSSTKQLTSIEYKADGTLVIENDEKEVLKPLNQFHNKKKLYKLKSKKSNICSQEIE